MPAQTQTEIRSLLAAAGLAPQHRFGQNFLVDLNLMRKLVGAAELHPDDVILEVGPGTGSLTGLLLDSGARVVAVEIDRGLLGLLRNRFAGDPRLTLVQADALSGKHRVNELLRIALRREPPGSQGAYKLVANLPYQIATPLLIDLLVGDMRFERLVCTIQREVGERLAAQPNTDAYGPVSVIAQTLARAELIAILPPGAFWPRPKVESVMLRIRPRPPGDVEVSDVRAFSAFIHDAFAQRRKMLRRLTRDWNPLDAARLFDHAGVSPDSRPEQIPPKRWCSLFQAWRAASQ